MKYDWLSDPYAQFKEAEKQGRRAHAYLICGLEGVGKRHLVRAMSHSLLGLEPAESWPEHPDFHRIEVPEKKTVISIDQVNELIGELTLTSHGGAVKVAVVDPASRLSTSGANALLKTLEEPNGNTCLFLIADHLRALPATILSRCQKVMIDVPDHAEAVALVESELGQRGVDKALLLADGAPFRAISLLQSGFVEKVESFESGLKSLRSGTMTAPAVAALWPAAEFPLVLDCLHGICERTIRCMLGFPTPDSDELRQMVPYKASVERLYQFKDRVLALKRVPKGGVNELMTLESLLFEWQNKFTSSEPEMPIMLSGRR